MAWQVIFSARSRIDLQKIVEYIARDNSAAAERFGSLLITQAESLANTPEMGPVLPQRLANKIFPGRFVSDHLSTGYEKARCAGLAILAFSASVASGPLKRREAIEQLLFARCDA